MPTVRASLLSNSAAFVRDRFGPDAHQRVLDALSPEVAARLSVSRPDTSRVRLEDLVAYMVAAKEGLAPRNEAFFREMGRFAGTRERSHSGFARMLADRETAIRMLNVMWHAYYSQGKLEVTSGDPASLTVRAVGFKGHPVLCERITGVAEAQLGASRSVHGACVFQGAPACEWTVWW